MTFFHLGRKFGYTVHSLRKNPFLVGSISTSLRYCPGRLSELSYYSLTWRFSSLLVCARHKCQLLECCCHCGNKISLFSSLKINTCSVCAKDLRAGQADVLTEKELQVTSKRLRDLEFLLSPQPCEKEENLKELVGNRLLAKRLPINVKTIDRKIGVEIHQMKLFDRG